LPNVVHRAPVVWYGNGSQFIRHRSRISLIFLGPYPVSAFLDGSWTGKATEQLQRVACSSRRREFRAFVCIARSHGKSPKNALYSHPPPALAGHQSACLSHVNVLRRSRMLPLNQLHHHTKGGAPD
jgi:hypothetical protein